MRSVNDRVRCWGKGQKAVQDSPVSSVGERVVRGVINRERDNKLRERW